MNSASTGTTGALAAIKEGIELVAQVLATTATPGPAADPKPKAKYRDIIIAVHGIGEQSRFATVRSVANRLAQTRELCGEGGPPPLAPQPLGYFHPDVRGATEVLRLDRFPRDPQHPLAGVGFTEVFWADIPQEVDRDGATLEDTKAWGRTIIARARAVYLSARPGGPTEADRLREPDFSLAGEVLDEIVETVEVLENLTFLARKAGVFSLDLNRILNEYLGDVQIVTEFTQSRRDIVGRFQQVLSRVHADYPEARLHIVAHSEGTVVSFLGLLHAMSGERVVPSAGEQGALLEQTGELPGWLRKVRGYMTLGSPIDKHLLLWPHLFDAFELSKAQKELGTGRIQWRNYYDYGDPVGFKLNTTRLWLKEKGCAVFEFDKDKHDLGFARYMLPGKAHNDYWGDKAVFEHFVSDVIARQDDIAPDPTTGAATQRAPGGALTRAKPPGTRWWTYVISPSVPYALSALLLIASVFLFYRAMVNFTQPPLDPVQNFVRYMSVGVPPPESTTITQLVLNALGVAALIAGTTLLSRWPRLTREKAWWLAGGAAFALGCAAYASIPKESRDAIGVFFLRWPDAGSWLTLGIPLSLALVAPWLPFTKGARMAFVSAGIVVLGILACVWKYPDGRLASAFGSLPAIEAFVTFGLVAGAFTLPWCGPRCRDDGTKVFRWWPALIGVGLFAAGVIFYQASGTGPRIDRFFDRWREPATYGTVCAALISALVGMTSIMPPVPRHRAEMRGRRTRWFRKGMRPLIACGAVAVAALVIYQAPAENRQPPLTGAQYNEMLRKFLAEMPVEGARQKARQVSDLITVVPPAWPVILSGLAFLYLWWLAALIFDLGFVWQRYVRRAVANERLFTWRHLEPPARAG
jgi:hypothetical protein